MEFVEYLNNDSDEQTSAWRMEVPGGWIYYLIVKATAEAFVPNNQCAEVVIPSVSGIDFGKIG